MADPSPPKPVRPLAFGYTRDNRDPVVITPGAADPDTVRRQVQDRTGCDRVQVHQRDGTIWLLTAVYDRRTTPPSPIVLSDTRLEE